MAKKKSKSYGFTVTWDTALIILSMIASVIVLGYRTGMLVKGFQDAVIGLHQEVEGHHVIYEAQTKEIKDWLQRIENRINNTK